MNVMDSEVIGIFVGYGLTAFGLGWSTAFLITSFKKFMEKI